MANRKNHNFPASDFKENLLGGLGPEEGEIGNPFEVPSHARC